MHITRSRILILVLGAAALAGCHLNDVLKVPVPAGVSSATELSNQSGAEAAYNEGMSQLFNAEYGSGDVMNWTELLSDEMLWSDFVYNAGSANIDARRTLGTGYPGFSESGDYPWQSLLQARTTIVAAIPLLTQYEPASTKWKAGEAYAMVGYAEIFIAEAYCSGTPLSQLTAGGGAQYGMPLSDDSILGVAEGHFDSALKYAAGNDSITNLADVGLGRVLLDRGHVDSAAAVTASVPATFLYNSVMAPNTSQGYFNMNMYAIDVLYNQYSFVSANAADGKGENGLHFISEHDPRLTFDTTLKTADGENGVSTAPWYLPNKFMANLSYIPMASGIEAALDQAEGALQASNTNAWLTDLNMLRNGNTNCTDLSNASCPIGTGQVPGQTTGLFSLTDPGTDSGRVSLMFHERAFWLYGTGSRLGDLRRLEKAPYSRDSSLVFPHGPYPFASNPNLPGPLATYGTDVELTLPTVVGTYQGFETNPNYKGCLTSTATP